jgi:sensor histidine kinase YesM
MTIEFCYLLFITPCYYLISYLIIPRFLGKSEVALFVISSLALILVAGWLRSLVAMQMNLQFFHPAQLPSSATLLTNSIINILFWVLLITTGKMMMDRIATQQRFELLEKERIKNELDYLKAQINPHALLNSLNTIYGKIDKHNQEARNLLLQFSALLQYQLYECSEEKVSLEKELAYIQNYVAFHRLRKDEKLDIHFEISNIHPGLKIDPLLLVVLIENAFKYVSNFSDQENKIIIDISTKDSFLNASFSNTREIHKGAINGHSNGIGLVNLKRRLELSYTNKYTLTNNSRDDIYETNLMIDLS